MCRVLREWSTRRSRALLQGQLSLDAALAPLPPAEGADAEAEAADALDVVLPPLVPLSRSHIRERLVRDQLQRS